MIETRDRNQRKTHRLLWAILITLLCAVVFGTYDRAKRTEEIKTATVVNRSMLNARARVQIILLNASLENRPLNAAEIDQIKMLWSKAEYDQADSPVQ